MSDDDGKRGSDGVVCSLVNIGGGKLRLILDDVSNSESSVRGTWSHRVLYTWKDLDATQVMEHSLSEKELADFGFHILARLTALHNHPHG